MANNCVMCETILTGPPERFGWARSAVLGQREGEGESVLGDGGVADPRGRLVVVSREVPGGDKRVITRVEFH
jgi:hypothetical protein